MLPDLDLDAVTGADGRFVLRLNGRPIPPEELRAPRVTAGVSYVARVPEVREWMAERQRAMAALGDIVMEGRDIGTVIFPEARFKFFLTASAETRARRRLAQAGESEPGATVESVAREIRERDRIDSTRALAPLRPAEDAVTVDTSDLDIDQVVDRLWSRIQEALPES
jgi:cytidylate kinase